MSLPLLHRRRPTLVPGPVVIPATPTTVVVEMLARYTTAHDLNPEAHTTRCGLALWPFWELDLVEARRYEVVFCDGCWRSHRCVICGVPSGRSNECARCLRDSLDADKRIERAA